MYIYICLCVCGWLCTLYDVLSWLHEWPFLVIRALNLVEWVCTQGNCCRCIFMLYCVHNHCDVIVLVHVTKWHWFPHVCDTHQHTWHFGGLWHIIVWACRYKQHTQMWNLADAPYCTKRETLLNFCCENGVSLLLYSHVKSLVRITFYVLWCIWGEVLSDFCHENKVKCRLIFAVEIKQWLQTHLEISIETIPIPISNLKA